MSDGSPAPAELWSELPPIRKAPILAVWDLIEELRAAGVPVVGSRPRRAGLFSGKTINVTLSVPDRVRSKASMMIAKRFPAWPDQRSRG